jgi:hypothetical protein
MFRRAYPGKRIKTTVGSSEKPAVCIFEDYNIGCDLKSPQKFICNAYYPLNFWDKLVKITTGWDFLWKLASETQQIPI